MSNIREVDDGDVPSAAKAEGLAHKQSTSLDNSIANAESIVKGNVSTGIDAGVEGGYNLSENVDISGVEIDPEATGLVNSIFFSDFLAERFGVKIKYINDPRSSKVAGRYESGTIYINVARAGSKSFYEIVGHEFGHAFKQINPAGYRELLTMVRNSTTINKQFLEYQRRVKNRYAKMGIELVGEKLDEVTFEEMLSDIFAETLKNPESIKQIANSDRQFAEKIRDILHALIDYLDDFFAGRKNENIRNFVRDFDKIEKRITEILTESTDARLKNNSENDIINPTNYETRFDVGGDIDGEKSENTQTLGEFGTDRNNDSIWQQSDDTEKNYQRLGRPTGVTQDGLRRGRGFVDWGRRIQSDGFNTTREKKRAYGILREISEKRISNVDVDGRPLSNNICQYFFGTVFKNEQGKLIPLFHATDGEFNVFKQGDFGFHVGSAEQAITRGGKYIKEVYVNITNPLIAKDRGIWPSLSVANDALSQGIITNNEYNAISKMDGFYEKRYDSPANASLRRLLIAKGYDGIVYFNEHEGEGISAIAFNSNQLKYTSNQSPTESDDIRFSFSDDDDFDYRAGWSDTTKRNVKEIDELVDMSGNVSDTSKIPTKRKLSNTKPKILSSLELINRQIDACRSIMQDPLSPAYKEAEEKLQKLYAERDKLTSSLKFKGHRMMVTHNIQLLTQLQANWHLVEIRKTA